MHIKCYVRWKTYPAHHHDYSIPMGKYGGSNCILLRCFYSSETGEVISVNVKVDLADGRGVLFWAAKQFRLE